MDTILSKERSQILMHNILCEILKADVFEDKDTYESWLRTEVGFTDEELHAFKEAKLLPEVTIEDNQEIER